MDKARRRLLEKCARILEAQSGRDRASAAARNSFSFSFADRSRSRVQEIFVYKKIKKKFNNKIFITNKKNLSSKKKIFTKKLICTTTKNAGRPRGPSRPPVQFPKSRTWWNQIPRLLAALKKKQTISSWILKSLACTRPDRRSLHRRGNGIQFPFRTDATIGWGTLFCEGWEKRGDLFTSQIQAARISNPLNRLGKDKFEVSAAKNEKR